MEADWEFEIGSNAPVIEAQWRGFVDLRTAPVRAAELPETRQLPGLADVLARLNGRHSSFWTCKTDVFVPEPIDPDELDATSEEAVYTLGCYVDLLPRSEPRWTLPSEVEQFCRELCSRLRVSPLRCCRVDVVVRRAHIGRHLDDLGATIYATACGPTNSDARSRLAACVSRCAALLVPGR